MPYGGTTPQQDKKIESCVTSVMPTLSQYKDSKVRKSHAIAICKSRIMKENRFSGQKLNFKEVKEEFYSEGFIMTDHPDEAVSEMNGRTFDGDIIPKSTLSKIVEKINSRTNPKAESASLHHDWIHNQDPNMPLAGVMDELDSGNLAELRQTEDGHWGAYIKTHHAKTHPEFENIKYDVENKIIPGYSIEFDPLSESDFVPLSLNGKTYRQILNLNLQGYGFAGKRNIANDGAKIVDSGYKEIMKFNAIKTKQPIINKKEEETKMEEEKKPEEGKEEVPAVEAEVPKEEEKVAEEVPKEEKVEEEAPAEEKEFKVDAAEYKMIQALKERKRIESAKSEVKEAIKAELKESFPMFNKNPEGKAELKEIQDFKTTCAEVKELGNYISKKDGGNNARAAKQNMLLSKQYKEASNLLAKCIELGVPVHRNSMDSMGAYDLTGGKSDIKSSDQFGAMEVKELQRMETKANEGLQFDTNADGWTYGSYNLSPAEYNDIFQPVLINQLNDQTTTWGKLQKKNFSGYSQIQVRARDTRNSTAAGYSEGANLTYGTDFAGTIGRVKYTQPFAYYRVLVAVTGQALQFAKSPGGIGDLWSNEVMFSGIDLQKVLNQAVIKSGGDGTSEALSLDFEHIILGATGTLYGRNIATYTGLKSHKESVSAYITLAQLRKMIRYVTGGDTTITHSNARVADLAFFCSPLQKDLVLSLIQNMQRLVPTSSRVGFEGVPEFDGVPIFADPDYNTDDFYCIDMSAMYVANNLPPTLELLPVTADAKAAHIKTYFNLFCDKPGNNYWTYGLST